MRQGLEIPCERVVRSLIPALRASIAKILYQKYHFTQVEISRLLGITQPAVNKYIYNKLNREVLELLEREEVKKLSEAASRSIAEGKYVNLRDLICELCRRLRASGCIG